MAKAKGRPKTSERDDVAVKINRAIVSQAKAIANFYGTSVAEVISETTREPMARCYARMLRDAEGKPR